jgi:hypothetical protein
MQENRWYDPNYTVGLIDLQSTLFWQQGHCTESTEARLKVMLYLFGLNLKLPVSKVAVEDSWRSELTGEVQEGGYVFKGRVRRDTAWVKSGKANIAKFLCTQEGVDSLLAVIDNYRDYWTPPAKKRGRPFKNKIVEGVNV